MTARIEAETRSVDEDGLGVEARLSDVSLVDGNPLLEVGGVVLGGLVTRPDGTRIESVELFGLKSELLRDEEGTWRGLGFALAGEPREPGRATRGDGGCGEGRIRPGLEHGGRGDEGGQRGSVELRAGSFRWRDSELAVVDNAEADAPRRFGAGPERRLRREPRARRSAGGSGRFGLWFDVSELGRRVGLGGSLRTGPDGSMELDAELGGQQLDTQALSPYLSELGDHPLIEQAEAAGRLELDLRPHGRSDLAGGRVSDVALEQPGRSWMRLDALEVVEARFGPEATDLGRISLSGTRIAVTRTEQGELEVAGLRFGTPPPRNDEVDLDALAAEEPDAEDEVPASATESGAPLLLGALGIEGLAVDWRDELLDPPLIESLELSGGLDSFALPAQDGPARFTLALRDSADRPWFDSLVT